MIRAIAWTLALALPSHALQSGTPLISDTLAVDLNTTPSTDLGSSNPFLLGTAGQTLYFTADNDLGQRQLFRTNGTPGSTVNVQTGQAGLPVNVAQGSAALPGDRLVLRGDQFGVGTELFGVGPGYDGVELIADIATQAAPGGTASSGPFGFTAWNGEVWFYADDGVNGFELWRTDGTAAGTQLAFDLAPGPDSSASVGGDISVAGGKLYFTATWPNVSLYVLDTPSGTPTLLATKDVFDPSPAVQMAEVNGALLFDWESQAAGNGLWRSDGTVQGTGLLASFPIPFFPAVFGATFIASDGNRLWLGVRDVAEGRELWVSDGTAGGTGLVADLLPGPVDGLASTEGAILNGRLIFAGRTSFTGPVELYATDGTAAGTAPVTDAGGQAVPVSFFEPVVWQGRAWFTGISDAVGAELFVTDGTSGAGTALAADLEPGPDSSAPRSFGAAPGFLFFGASFDGNGFEPVASDGSTLGSQLLIDLVLDPVNVGSDPTLLRRFRDLTIFRATTPDFGAELYVSDGSPAGTQLLADVRPGPAGSDPMPLTEIDAGLLFSVEPLGTGRELWITDGTPAGTQQVAVFDDGFPPQPWTAQRLDDGFAYFTTDLLGTEVWRTDGTPAGTQPVTGYAAVPNFSEANEALNAAGSWYFDPELFNGTGRELWRTDGTPSGTQFVADLVPGPFSSTPREFTPLGGETVFVATSADFSSELWITDGTDVGTQQITDIVPPGVLEEPTDLNRAGDRIVFRFDDGVHGSELWVTDGTAAGTQLLADLAPGPASSEPGFFEAVGDELFFWARIAIPSPFTEKWALFRTDGTSAGTVLIDGDADLGPLSEFAAGVDLTAIGGSVLFGANAPAVGGEIWVSDGTNAGTRVVSDIAPGSKSSFAQEFVPVGDRVLFSATDFLAGQELHAVALADLELWSATEVGLGCGADLSAAGSAQLGATLELTSTNSAPASPGGLFWSADLTFTDVGPNCRLHLGVPTLLAPFTTDAQAESNVALAVPAVPAIAGLPLYFQSVAAAPGGAFLGAFELSNAVEAVAAP